MRTENSKSPDWNESGLFVNITIRAHKKGGVWICICAWCTIYMFFISVHFVWQYYCFLLTQKRCCDIIILLMRGKAFLVIITVFSYEFDIYLCHSLNRDDLTAYFQLNYASSSQRSTYNSKLHTNIYHYQTMPHLKCGIVVYRYLSPEFSGLFYCIGQGYNV